MNPKKRRMVLKMKKLEYTGKTVDEATEQALKQLKVNLEDLEIEVISPGRAGILGLGGEQAQIEVSFVNPAKAKEAYKRIESTSDEGEDENLAYEEEEERPKRSARRDSRRSKPPDPKPPVSEPSGQDPEAENTASEILTKFLNFAGVETRIFIKEELENGHIVFEIEGDDSALLIGRHGETLRSLQFLVGLLTRQTLDRNIKVLVDVEGYRERRGDKLRGVARRSIQQVIRTGRPLDLPPMPATDRRVVHMYASQNSAIITESEGEGRERHIVLRPRRRRNRD